MLLPLQRGFTYGPVRSRRLGRSLGINLLPAGRKLCNFDCRYCQYGWTDPAVLTSTPPEVFPAVEAVIAAVAGAAELDIAQPIGAGSGIGTVGNC